MGMVPNLVTGVWVGNEDRSARFKSITYGQGQLFAGLFTMKLCYADPQLKVSKEEFERPENLSIKWIVTLLQKQKQRPFKIQMN
jgi:penicillin-binding protein 1A